MDEAQMHRLATRLNVAEWITVERRDYADRKWHDDASNRATALRETKGETGEWYLDYIRSYLHRAGILGLDTPLGRQALGKAVVTALAALETSVEVFGPLPKPGVPSGEIQ